MAPNRIQFFDRLDEDCEPSLVDSDPEATVSTVPSSSDLDESASEREPFPSFNDSALPAHLLDRFDAQGVSSDTMEVFDMIEKQNMMWVARRETPLTPPVREVASRFLQYLVYQLKLPPGAWFTCTALLDTLSPSMNELPATCVALSKIVKKNDCATFSWYDQNLTDLACKMKHALKKLGVEIDDSTDVTDDDINRQELKVLYDLSWQVNVPTMESWSSIFYTRLSILTCNSFEKSMIWIWQHVLQYSWMIVMHRGISEAMAPRKAAAGLLCFFLVSAQTLPLSAVSPDTVDKAEWEDQFVRLQPERKMPVCHLAPEHEAYMVKSLEVATCCSISALKEYTAQIATIMHAVIPDSASFRAGQPWLEKHTSAI
eukprot:gnl/TRDRNA2_/TRDRNA2_206222_c0_seq1.p1 gnl/TRDRNA2_/TRDRNA2_206222_c0~~gnl/TRDRNA2_/TRDRNA2_206222_c0_seq1.p1  ORF type:complete len:397 (+),score=59.08 gnl/TRDRNA2_/TRDRNA2_206222_c0_seq1:77-1192(+)